jgi:hypothetical protein
MMILKIRGAEAARCGRMHVRMHNAEALSPQQINDFLKASEAVRFAGQTRGEIYAWVEQALVAQQYHKRGKQQRGSVRAYLAKVTGPTNG